MNDLDFIVKPQQHQPNPALEHFGLDAISADDSPHHVLTGTIFEGQTYERCKCGLLLVTTVDGDLYWFKFGEDEPWPVKNETVRKRILAYPCRLVDGPLVERSSNVLDEMLASPTEGVGSAATVPSTEEITRALDAYPELTDFGFELFGLFGHDFTRDQVTAAHRAMYDIAVEKSAILQEATAWLNTWPRTKNVNWKLGTSYRLKHQFSREMEPRLGNSYITNGLFILAAVLAGLAIKRSGPNAYLNLGSRRVRRGKFK